VTLSVIDSFLG